MNRVAAAAARHHPLRRITAAVAVAGGLVLLAAIVLTVVSVTGRALGGSALGSPLRALGLGPWLRPVPGDYELVEMGVALAVFAFLPWCQAVRGNVAVDFFTARLPARAQAALVLAGDLLYLLLAVLLAWRLAAGGTDMHAYAQTTMVLRVPVWWVFPPIVACCVLLAVTCAWTAWRALRCLRAGVVPGAG